MGLYFYSSFWDQVIDYKRFLPDYCDKMRYCQEVVAATGSKTLQISLDESKFSTLNFLPKDPSVAMAAKLEYRLLNKEEDQFVFETLAIIAVGIILILVFSLFDFLCVGVPLFTAQTERLFLPPKS